MIYVTQTEEHDFGPPLQRGNCKAACVASIFELRIEDVPPKDDFSALVRWTQMHFPGLMPVNIQYNEPREEPPLRQGLWIAGVESPRVERDCHHCDEERAVSDPPWFAVADCPWCHGTRIARGGHAVVYDGRRLLHDPHPDAVFDDDEFTARFIGETYWIVVDPARVAPRTPPRAYERV